MQKALKLAIFAFMFLLAVLVIIKGISQGQTSLNYKAPVDFSQSWSIMKNGSSVSSIDLPANLKENNANDILTIKKSLPKDLANNNSLLIRSSQQSISVSLDGTNIYSFGKTDSKSFCKSPGSSWHFIELPENSGGKDITITLTSPYNKYAGILNQIFLGSKSSELYWILYYYGINGFISLCLILIGLIGLCLGLLLYQVNQKSTAILYLAFFAFLTGFWTLGESKLMQFIYDNPLFIYMQTFVSLYLLPIPMLLFIINTYSLKSEIYIKHCIYAHIAFFVSATLLQITGIMDYMQTVSAFEIMILITASITCIVCVKEISYSNHRKAFFASLIILSVCAVADSTFNFLFPSKNSSSFTQIGYFVFIFIQMTIACNYLHSLYYAKEKNETLKSIAYTDSLTGLENRTSFFNYFKNLELKFPNLDGLTMIMCDVNNLKTINDLYGHPEGDLVIQTSADIIKKSFQSLGHIFRIGGDEFMIIIKNIPTDIILDAKENFLNEIEIYNLQNQKFDLNIAIGIATFDIENDNSVNDLFIRSDAQMYQDKYLKKHCS